MRPGQPTVGRKHVAEPLATTSLCLPLLAQGEVIGLSHVTSARKLTEDSRKRWAILGEQISMALANLALREKLRNQSIRDPLTGLFVSRMGGEELLVVLPGASGADARLKAEELRGEISKPIA